MRAYARKFHPGSAPAEELWGVVGLLQTSITKSIPASTIILQGQRNIERAGLFRRDTRAIMFARRIFGRDPRLPGWKKLLCLRTNWQDSSPLRLSSRENPGGS